MKKSNLFLFLLLVSLGFCFIPNKYQETVFYLFVPTTCAFLMLYEYSRKVNPILKSLGAHIKKVDKELMGCIWQLRKVSDELSIRIQKLENKRSDKTTQ